MELGGLPVPQKRLRAMDLAKALEDLRSQRDDLDQAILSLERLASGRPRGRGRPPGRSSIRTSIRTRKRPPVPSRTGTEPA